LIGTDRQGKQFRVSLPPQHEELVSELRKKNVEIWYRNSESGSVATWIANFGPILLIAALWFFMVRIMRRRQSQSLPPGTPSPPADNRWRQP
jgi:ATP-dependent Zn protease